MTEGLRQRKKARTRRLIANAALARFARDGFDATSVQQICDDAEVAVSTFYGYFPSKEATAFPDDDTRADQVAAALRDAPASEPPHRLLRAASLNLAKHDQANRSDVLRRLEVIAHEPALGAYAARRQAEHIERFTALLAARLHVDHSADLRPRLAVATAMAAISAAWAAWLSNSDADLVELVNQAHDALDAGLAHIFLATGTAVRRKRPGLATPR
jgi:AcrR family transcriptional regulator